MFRLEVIQFHDPTGQTLVARVPEHGTAAIKYGAQLIVDQSQVAVFFRDGRAMDQFGPGRHTLTTANLPVIGGILTLPFEKSPFQAAVYYIGRQTFLDQRWGTRQPITLRDRDFGVVRLRGFGKFAYRVADPSILLNTVVGTQGRYTTEQILDYLRDLIVAALTDVLATAGVPLLELPARMDELSAGGRVKLQSDFANLGLELVDLRISSLSPPEEVQKAIDARSSMTVLGDLNSYMTYSAAKGIEAAGNSGNAGMGFGMGMALPSILQQAMQAAAPRGNGTAAAVPVGQTSAPADSQAATRGTDPLQMTKQIAESSGWKVIAQSDDEIVLNVPVGSLRRQKVTVQKHKPAGLDYEMLSIWSVCGPVNPASAALLLRSNDEMVHGSLSLRTIEGGEQLVLRGNLLIETLDALEISRTVSAIAWQADQIEGQLSGVDEQ